ncbi:MAG TPA: hypothetical protein VN256_11665 [Pyrinomonadaceae bacterium]|nr:hypothetical protein [Pyrinomonadaceae bacterium]
MNDAPRETLRELIARHGRDLCSDARRCEGLLRDLCGEHRREINLLVGALRERVPLDLMAAQGSVPRGLLLTRLSRRLEDQLAVTEEAARWAVDSWALALGVATNADVAEREKEFARASRKAPAHPADENEKNVPQVRPPAAPPPSQARPPQPQPPARQTPPAKQTQPARRQPGSAPRRTQAPAPTGRNPFVWPDPLPPAQADPPFIQLPADAFRPRGLLGSFRGCAVGCLVLVVLSFVLFVGVPFVLSVLREEQQQRSVEPPPVRTQ